MFGRDPITHEVKQRVDTMYCLLVKKSLMDEIESDEGWIPIKSNAPVKSNAPSMD